MKNRGKWRFFLVPDAQQTKLNNSYTIIGHFSKFIRPGALRVSTSTSRTTIQSTSFQNDDGTIVTVVMNSNDDKVSYKLIIDDLESKFEIEPRAMQTIIY